MTKPNMRKDWKAQRKGKPGPLKKREWYAQRIRDIYDEGFFSEWKNSEQIAFEVNKYYPKAWTPIAKYAVHSYIKRLPELRLSHRIHGKNAASQVSEWRATGERRGKTCDPK